MSQKKHYPIPVHQALRKLGKEICDARRRRRISTQLMSDRAGFSRVTLSKIEKGEAGVSIGLYASALFVLGMIDRLGNLMDPSSDIVGRELEEDRLPKRVRLPKSHEK